MAYSITFSNALFDADRIGLSTAALARLVGISPGTLRNAINETGKLSSVREAEIATVVARLKAFHDALHPLPLPSSWEALRELTISPLTPNDAAQFVAKLFPISRDED